MEQIPKIARDRLGASRAAEHPDPDLLTAFAEHTLSERERVQVLSHLSHCAECREVVSLTVPEIEPVLVVAAAPSTGKPASKTWLSWPLLRWGALAACVVVVGAAVWLRHLERRPPAEPAEVDALRNEPKSDVPPLAQNQAQVSPVPATTSDLNSETKKEVQKDAEAPTTSASRHGSGRGTAVANKPRQPGLMAKTKTAAPPTESRASAPAAAQKAPGFFSADAAKPSPPLPSSRMVVVAPPPPMVARNGAPANRSKARDQDQTEKQSLTETLEVTGEAAEVQTSSAQLRKTAKQRGRAQATGAASAKAASQNGTPPLAALAVSANGHVPDLKAPTWTLSDDGLPQRSFDLGDTWEKVQVDHSTGFRALAALGYDVWVGGSGGVLYHSSDVGLHWTRINPTANGDSLTADIVKIDFADLLHGTVTTANDETWLTADSGKTWQKH